MILFPEWFVNLIILGALFLTAVATVALIVMLMKDFTSKDIW